MLPDDTLSEKRLKAEIARLRKENARLKETLEMVMKDMAKVSTSKDSWMTRAFDLESRLAQARDRWEESWDDLEDFLAKRLMPIEGAKWSECMQEIDKAALRALEEPR